MHASEQLALDCAAHVHLGRPVLRTGTARAGRAGRASRISIYGYASRHLNTFQASLLSAVSVCLILVLGLRRRRRRRPDLGVGRLAVFMRKRILALTLIILLLLRTLALLWRIFGLRFGFGFRALAKESAFASLPLRARERERLRQLARTRLPLPRLAKQVTRCSNSCARLSRPAAPRSCSCCAPVRIRGPRVSRPRHQLQLQHLPPEVFVSALVVQRVHHVPSQAHHLALRARAPAEPRHLGNWKKM